MLISIAERFRPFSRVPGIACLLPFSKLGLRVYPAYLEIYDLSLPEPIPKAKFSLPVRGPVNGFTVMQDLEKGYVKVWGESLDGYFRYRIYASDTVEGFAFAVEKSSDRRLSDALPGAFQGGTLLVSPAVERLSFGIAKKADWTSVDRRLTLAEILPFWFRLGQMIPEVIEHSEGTAGMLSAIENGIENKDVLNLPSYFKTLYLGGFDGLLNCHLDDCNHQGLMLTPSDRNSSNSPLILLTKGARLIRQMLLSKRSSDRIDILPCLLPELHAGRLCNASLGDSGWLDLEWSKKQTRRISFYSAKRQAIAFCFQSRLKSYRLQKADGSEVALRTCGDVVEFEADTTYYFDRFRH